MGERDASARRPPLSYRKKYPRGSPLPVPLLGGRAHQRDPLSSGRGHRRRDIRMRATIPVGGTIPRFGDGYEVAAHHITTASV